MIGRLGDMGGVDAAVIEYAVRGGGVITRAEAVALGMSPSTIQRRVAEGQLVAVGRGVYVLPGVLESESSLLRAATKALAATVSHESAARLHGLDNLGRSRISVSVPIRRSNRFPDTTVHQLTDLEPGHTTVVDGLPVTNPTRTMIDLASVLGPKLLADLLDQGVRKKLTSYRAVADMHESLARRGKPGVAKLRRILEPRLDGQFVFDSTLETKLTGVLLDGGLPSPETQFRPEWLRQMNGRVDLAYPEYEVLIEGDSQRWHGGPEAFQADRRRDNLAQLAGWTILRFTWEDITKRPSYVVASVSGALDRSARLKHHIRAVEP